ncbi:MAG: beta-lactamase family protein [Gammaproteobacteria bacterium]|nr:beta-lactamase family protein [Gammaproteobacteria bacterium]
MTNRLSTAGKVAVDSMKLLLGMAFILSQPAYSQSIDISELVNQFESESNVLNVDAAVWSNEGVCSTTSKLENNTTLTQRYHAASISKLFTAIVIMQLRDEGKLNLDDTLGVYLPEFETSKVQIQHLLTHTSSIRDRQRANGRTSVAEVDEYIQKLANRRSRNPGERWRYADANFNLLGRIIETLSGATFADVMKERLLEPLQMFDSSFDISLTPEDAKIVAYSKRERAYNHPWDLAFLPSSGLQTTAADLTKFGMAVLDIVASPTNDFLLKESLLEMTEVQLDTNYEGVGQGLAWQIVETNIGLQWRHAGGEDGFESLITIYPNAGITIAVLGNQKDWPRFELERELRNAANANLLTCLSD